jgi:hypothetical protein
LHDPKSNYGDRRWVYLFGNGLRTTYLNQRHGDNDVEGFYYWYDHKTVQDLDVELDGLIDWI